MKNVSMKTIRKEMKPEWDLLLTTFLLVDLELLMNVKSVVQKWFYFKNLMLSIFLSQQFSMKNIINPFSLYRNAWKNLKKLMWWKAETVGSVISVIPKKQPIEKWEFMQLIKF